MSSNEVVTQQLLAHFVFLFPLARESPESENKFGTQLFLAVRDFTSARW
jgi:hypothetical protein